MGKTANSFRAHLDGKGVKYTHYPREEKRKEAVKINFGGDNADEISITFFFDDDDELVNIKCFTIAKVPADKLMDTYVILNDLNCEYRWVKFYVDQDNEVTVSGDAIINEYTAGEVCTSLMYRYVNIIDEVYPRIMKVIWA